MATTLANEIILDKGTLVDGVQIYGMTKEDLINVATDLNIHFSNGDSTKELIIEILEELNILFKNNELPQNIDHMKLAMARQSESIKMRVIQHIQNKKVEHDNEEVQTCKEGDKETNCPNNNNAPIIITNPIVPKREVDESLTSWLKRFELHLKSNRIPESLHFDTLMNALSEEERAIVNIEKHKGNKIISNFKDLSTLLIRETMIGQPIEEFYRIHRKTDESIAIYFSRLESMAEIAFATWSIKEKEDQLKSQFIRGINNESMARKFFRLTQQTDGRSLSSIVISATQIEAEEKFICDNYRKVEMLSTREKFHSDVTKQESTKKNNYEGKCRRCVRNSCSFHNKDPYCKWCKQNICYRHQGYRNPTEGMKWNSNRRGNEASLQKNNEKDQFNVISLCNFVTRNPPQNDECWKAPVSRIGKLYFSNVELNGKAVQSLIDGGAEHSVITEKICSQIDNIKLQPIEKNIIGALNQQSIKIRNEAMLTVNINGFTFVSSFYVVPTFNHQCVIGSNILSQYNLAIDYKNGNLIQLNNVTEEKEEMMDNSENLQSIQNVIDENTNAPKDPISIIKHTIETTNNRPIRAKKRRYSHGETEIIEKMCNNMLANGIIEISTSEWVSNIVIVNKKNGDNRFCVNYRPLNNITKDDNYPFPRIDEIVEAACGHKWYSKLDMVNGFHQIEIEEKDREKTAFRTQDKLFQFKRMPFGLKNAPSTFSRLMQMVLNDFDYVKVYMDDVIIFSADEIEHIKHITNTLRKLTENNLRINRRKCEFFRNRIVFLGYCISEDGIEVDQRKTDAMKSINPPCTIKQVQSMIGIVNYYRNFIEKFATIVEPLYNIVRSKKFSWSSNEQTAWEKIVEVMTEAPILRKPDFTRNFILQTDASNIAIGAVLYQKYNGKEFIISYGSKILTKQEKVWHINHLESYSIYFFIKHYKYYLQYKQFTVRTDNKAACVMLLKSNEVSPQIWRWRMDILEYDFTIEYVKGINNGTADLLSRPSEICSLNSINCDSIEKLQLEDGFDKKFENNEDFEKVNNLWCKRSKHKATLASKGNFTNHRIVIPDAMINDFIEKFHNDAFFGHKGQKNTLQVLSQQYFHPNMKKNINRIISFCELCRRSKNNNRSILKHFMKTTKNYPMDEVQLDVFGPLDKSTEGNQFIIIFTDRMSKLMDLFATKNHTATTIIKCLREFISRFGKCRKLVTDCGSEMISQQIHDYCKLIGINKSNASPRHHESIGQVERMNKSVAEQIRIHCLLTGDQRSWDEKIPYIRYSMNAFPNTSTKLSPYQIIYRYTTQPPSTCFPNIDNSHNQTSTFSSFDKILKNCRQNNRMSTNKYIDHINNESVTNHHSKLAIGDVVRKKMIQTSTKGECSAKLKPLYSETFSVIDIYENGNVKIQSTNDMIETIHQSCLIKDSTTSLRPKRNTTRKYNR